VAGAGACSKAERVAIGSEGARPRMAHRSSPSEASRQIDFVYLRCAPVACGFLRSASNLNFQPSTLNFPYGFTARTRTNRGAVVLTAALSRNVTSSNPFASPLGTPTGKFTGAQTPPFKSPETSTT
jgi:hypothetical protein